MSIFFFLSKSWFTQTSKIIFYLKKNKIKIKKRNNFVLYNTHRIPGNLKKIIRKHNQNILFLLQFYVVLKIKNSFKSIRLKCIALLLGFLKLLFVFQYLFLFKHHQQLGQLILCDFNILLFNYIKHLKAIDGLCIDQIIYKQNKSSHL